MDNAWKFVQWDVQELDTLKDSFPYRMRLKLNNGEALTQEEKDNIFADISRNIFSRSGIPLGGWMFDFSDYCRQYYVEFTYGHIQKYWAPNKTAIRHDRYTRPLRRIVEVK
ncbi:MAG: molybdenum ABC transporter ATP-binding protein [Dehalococcoidales bacterium]|nr:molybdenum ABC transporter ATP-binding protein [Dehalococcoidales bacterium]